MNIIKKLVKESNAAGNRLEAVILDKDGSLAVKYYVNGSYKHEEIFEGKELAIVEGRANNWLSEVRDLNG
jgi:hypothetical protein